MGREIKRVAMDFDWPLCEVWRGYVNPHYQPCPNEGVACFDGYTAAGKWLDGVARFIVLLGEQSVEKARPNLIYPHPYLSEFSNRVTSGAPSYATIPPSKEFEQLVVGLGARPLDGRFFGHDSIDSHSVEKRIIEAANLPAEWGTCPVCDGACVDPACKEAYESWSREEPPSGDGWQVWETVSEGSPVSPVFATAEELIEYLVEGGDESDRKHGEPGVSREAATRFVKETGWVPSGMMSGGGFKSNIECAGE